MLRNNIHEISRVIRYMPCSYSIPVKIVPATIKEKKKEKKYFCVSRMLSDHSVIEFPPVMRVTRVRSPATANFFPFLSLYFHVLNMMKSGNRVA